MLGFIKFWGRSLRSAFRRGWAVFGTVSTLLPAAISLIQRHSPELGAVPWIKWVAENQAEIQVCIAALFLVPYLLYAPYRLYKEQGAKLEALQSSDQSEIAEKLAEFLADGEHFKSLCENPRLEIFPGDQIKLWANKLDAYLKARLGNAYAVRGKNPDGILPQVISLAPGVEHAVWWAIHVRCVRLNQFIEELSSQRAINSSKSQK